MKRNANRRRPVLGIGWLMALAVTLSAGVGRAQLATLQPDASGRVTYFIAGGEPGSQFRPGDRELATWALKVWENSLAGALRFEPAPTEDEALVRIYWVPASAGQYGEMRPLLVRGPGHDEERTRERVNDDAGRALVAGVA